MPAPEHQRRIVPEKVELQIREIELAHGPAIRIIFPVTREYSAPSTRNPAASRKREFRRMPVALQKRVHVSLVPVVLLSFQDLCDCSAVALMFLGRRA